MHTSAKVYPVHEMLEKQETMLPRMTVIEIEHLEVIKPR